MSGRGTVDCIAQFQLPVSFTPGCSEGLMILPHHIILALYRKGLSPFFVRVGMTFASLSRPTFISFRLP